MLTEHGPQGQLNQSGKLDLIWEGAPGLAWSLYPLSSSSQRAQWWCHLAWGKLTPTRQWRGVAMWVSKGAAPLLSLASLPAFWWPGLLATDKVLNAQTSWDKAGQGQSSFPRFWRSLVMHEWILPCRTSGVADPTERRSLKTTAGVWTCIIASQCWIFFEGGFSSPFPPLLCHSRGGMNVGAAPGMRLSRSLMDTTSWICRRAGASQAHQAVGLLSMYFSSLVSQQKSGLPACNYEATTFRVNSPQPSSQPWPPSDALSVRRVFFRQSMRTENGQKRKEKENDMEEKCPK